jgi:flagellar motor protein MotB
MRAAGRGERELKVPTDDNVDSPINRRVEVIVR